MTIFKRGTCILLAALLLLCAAPAAFAKTPWNPPGNTDLNISNGGLLLQDGNTLYYSDGGIFASVDGEVRILSSEAGKNLNLADTYIYYTLPGGVVRRISTQGGLPETVYTHGEDILRMYVMGGKTLLFLSGGRVYISGIRGEGLELLSAPANVTGLIPTAYGNLYLTGTIFDYSLWTETTELLEHVTSCYTDSGYLVISQNEKNWQIDLANLFGEFDPTTDLEPFHVHENEQTVSLFGLTSEDSPCAECEAQAAALYMARLMSADEGDMDFAVENPEADAQALDEPNGLTPSVSEGQRNIVLRARQMHEIQWTPLENRYQWGGQGIFQAGTTYTGLPYGQPVNTGYVPWTVSFDTFLDAVNNNASKFYTTYSTYNKTAPSYSCDCSAFVSYAWGLEKRYTTRSLPSVAELVSDQSIYSIQIGDALNNASSHVVLVSDVRYNELGELVSIEIMEQTPVITKRTLYGQGGEQSLSRLQSYYLNGGYVILRNPDRDSVTYTHSCAVPIDGDYCANCSESAPKAWMTASVGTKTVELYHDDANAQIYYTADGSTPSTGSSRYTGALTFHESTQLRAIAVTGKFASSRELQYTVQLPNAAEPSAVVSTGAAEGGLIAYGSQIQLTSTTTGAIIYYTTDGSAPNASSAKYTGPISVQVDIHIRAIAQAVGMHESEIADIRYKAVQSYTIQASAGLGGSITPAGDTTVLGSASKTFQITANTGYKLTDVQIDGSSVGPVSTYTFENVAGNHSISASFVSTENLPFTDVGEGNWFFNAVSYAYKNNLFSGTSTSTFSPNDSMTRGMFVTVLGRYAGVPSTLSKVGVVTASQVRIRREANTQSEVLGICEKFDIVDIFQTSNGWYQVQAGQTVGWIRGDLMVGYNNRFTDVSADKYYSNHVAWASLMGIVNGVSDTSYAPSQNITREQMCVMLYNYIGKYQLQLRTDTDLEVFADDSAIAGYAKEAVYALKNAGVISGVGGGSFQPKGTATRAQVAQIMMNFISAIQ